LRLATSGNERRGWENSRDDEDVAEVRCVFPVFGIFIGMTARVVVASDHQAEEPIDGLRSLGIAR